MPLYIATKGKYDDSGSKLGRIGGYKLVGESRLEVISSFDLLKFGYYIFLPVLYALLSY